MNTLIFHDTGTQYSIDSEGVENLVREQRLTSKWINGAFAQYAIGGEYLASILVPVHSEVYALVDAKWKSDRKASRVKA